MKRNWNKLQTLSNEKEVIWFDKFLDLEINENLIQNRKLAPSENNEV